MIIKSIFYFQSRTPYTPQNAKYVAKQAKYSYDKAVKYKDEFVSICHNIDRIKNISLSFMYSIEVRH